MGITGFLGYQIFKNGNEFVAEYADIKKAYRKLNSLGNRGVYVELWACYADFSRHLVDYRN